MLYSFLYRFILKAATFNIRPLELNCLLHKYRRDDWIRVVQFEWWACKHKTIFKKVWRLV